MLSDQNEDRLDWLFFKILEIACSDEFKNESILKSKRRVINKEDIVVLREKAIALRFESMLAKGLSKLGFEEDKWMQRARACALFSSFVYSEAVQFLSEYLISKQIQHAFLKGSVSDIIFYGGSGLRGTSDIDVWLVKNDSKALDKLVDNFKWSVLKQNAFQATVEASHGRPYIWKFMGQKILVDVHFRLSDPPIPDFGEGTAIRIQSYPFENCFFYALSPEDWIVYSAVNLAIDGLSGRVKQAIDVAQIIKTSKEKKNYIDETLLFDLAEEMQVKHALWGLLMLVSHKLSQELSSELMQKLVPPIWKRRWVLSLFGVDQKQLAWRGMPVRLLLPDNSKANLRSLFGWSRTRISDRLLAMKPSQ